MLSFQIPEKPNDMKTADFKEPPTEVDDLEITMSSDAKRLKLTFEATGQNGTIGRGMSNL